MKAFHEIKKEFHSITIEHPERETKYGMFLDKLATEYDQRGENELWDIWYFSLNTDFCRDASVELLNEIREQIAAYRIIQNSKGSQEGSGNNDFNIDKLRRLHGSLCFYLYAAMESFAHEINLFYEINQRRRDVNLTRINKHLKNERGACALSKHLQEMLSNPVIKEFLDYRNAIMHGYVYPISMQKNRIGIGGDPRSSLFSFKRRYIDILDFSEKSHTNINHLIVEGWRCFERDELS
jgi:hypothetical protein